MMALADCGQTLTFRAANIEYLTRLLCDIDRGKWVSTRHSKPTPEFRKEVVLLVGRQLAAVPPEHCASCGRPMDTHVKRQMPVHLMGCGR